MKSKKTKSALISSYRKNKGLAEFAKSIQSLGFNIYASQGTAEFLRHNRIKAVNIKSLVGFPPILDHRVVSLHPKIHAGILAKNLPGHEKELEKMEIPRFDLVLVDLYPVEKAVKSGQLDKVLDLVDIGGPTMIRGAAKNFNNNRVVICDLADSKLVLKKFKASGEVDFLTRKLLAAKVFAKMRSYDGLIADFLGDGDKVHLRYGENPHQKGWFIKEESDDPLAIQNFKQTQGKELSFNNFLDIDSVISALSEVGGQKPSCAIVKHTNLAGFSVQDSALNAYSSAWLKGDPLAAFGGVVGINREVDGHLAKNILFETNGNKKFIEVLLAPAVTKEAADSFLKQKNLRILVNPSLRHPRIAKQIEQKKVRGGTLYQENDVSKIAASSLKVVTKRRPKEAEVADLLFAWKAVKLCKSNAICIVINKTLLSSGVGQQDRLEACKIAVAKGLDSRRGKSKRSLVGSVAASDAFFPFSDGPEVLVNAGVKAIIQPGGSIRDQEVIDFCDKNRVSLVFTSVRAFKH